MKKITPILLIINLSLFVISLAISFVILFRPFYYWQIKSLNIEENIGLDYDDIKEVYDSVLDYSVLNKEFNTHQLTCNSECIDHFKDCKRLFIINFVVLLLSTIIFIFLRKYYHNYLLKKHSLSFWSGCSLLLFFISIALITVIVGFNSIFTLFHNTLFLGKSNWIFDPKIDTIVNIFPKQFFINCSILILVIISSISIILIVKDLRKVVKK